MKNINFALVLLLTFPCTLIQASHRDLETIQYLVTQYEKCIKKAAGDYGHSSQQEDLIQEKKRCELILQANRIEDTNSHEQRIAKVERKNSWLEKSNDLQQEEIKNLRKRIEYLEALQRKNNRSW